MYAITMKRGILLAAFGSGSSQGESTLRRFDAQVRKAFPDVSVRWAFTSMLMRERLASERKKSDSVHKALKKMAFEKFTHVAVQPVHVIPGRCASAQKRLSCMRTSCVPTGRSRRLWWARLC